MCACACVYIFRWQRPRTTLFYSLLMPNLFLFTAFSCDMLLTFSTSHIAKRNYNVSYRSYTVYIYFTIIIIFFFFFFVFGSFFPASKVISVLVVLRLTVSLLLPLNRGCCQFLLSHYRHLWGFIHPLLNSIICFILDIYFLFCFSLRFSLSLFLLFCSFLLSSPSPYDSFFFCVSFFVSFVQCGRAVQTNHRFILLT